MKFYSFEDWAQSLRLASDDQVSEFGTRVLDLVECEELAGHYSDMLADLEKRTEKKFPTNEPWRWSEYVEALVSEKEEAYSKRKERALRVNAAKLPPALEYDL